MVSKYVYKGPRGKCRHCGKTFALKKDGTLRFHTSESRFCYGSGQAPAESTVTSAPGQEPA